MRNLDVTGAALAVAKVVAEEFVHLDVPIHVLALVTVRAKVDVRVHVKEDVLIAQVMDGNNGKK